jgi:hypothetical protein
MNKISPEVLIYIQSVKNYFETNIDVKEYFLNNSDEELFFKHMIDIAQKNYIKNGEAILNREQFELLRKTIAAITIAGKKKVEIKNEDFDYDNGVFIGLPIPNFGMICLN